MIVPQFSCLSHISSVNPKVFILVRKFHCQSQSFHVIPTVLIFHNGEVVGRQVGVASHATYEDSINSLLHILLFDKVKLGFLSNNKIAISVQAEYR